MRQTKQDICGFRKAWKETPQVIKDADEHSSGLRYRYAEIERSDGATRSSRVDSRTPQLPWSRASFAISPVDTRND